MKTTFLNAPTITVIRIYYKSEPIAPILLLYPSSIVTYNLKKKKNSTYRYQNNKNENKKC